MDQKEVERFTAELMEILEKEGKHPDKKMVADFAEDFLLLLNDTEE